MNKLFGDLPEDDGLPGATRRVAIIVVIFGTSMSVLDGSIVNVALPTIARSLQVDAAAAVWIANAYILAGAITMVAFASLGEVLGFRRVYMSGILVFTLASLGCALSPSLAMLTGMRFLQGLGGAAAMSIGPALYRNIFPTRLLGAALGVNALVVASSTAAGPAIGGLMLSVLSWPWLFAINVPIGIITLLMAWSVLPRDPGRGGKFDAIGAVLSAVALGTFVMAVDGLARHDSWGKEMLLFAIALVSIVLFIIRQRRYTAPLLPLDIFASQRFSMAVATSLCSFVGQGIAFIALPFLFQGAYGYSPLVSAALFTPWPVAIAITAPIAGRLADHYSASLLSTCGLLVLTLGLVLLACLGEHASIPDILWRAFVCGLGFGFFQSPNNREMLSNAPRARSGTASGMLAIARTFGQSLGAALVAVVLAATSIAQASADTAHIDASAVHLSLWLAAGAALLATVISALRIKHGRN
ncbi:MFS transporter, DHA2 family, multidrug resistance protein [Collimonas sp. OK607]|uniref:MFS transporter n=1 Tax=Collimonas sp. OK607 TaxID=1798194 RepID=UPI0008F3ACE9|nr:MFS transporter [Collimonas sp. OK607]SFB16603.1 MFS transporter, DHA2 family, multidrug resistance protein [Collimonas sp. OK607]